MRDISQTLHQLFCNSANWEVELTSRLQALKREMGNPICAVMAFEVAQAFEHCVADREGAVAAYVLCYRSEPKRIDALARARRISKECGDFATLAKLSHLQYKVHPIPELLAAEGIAWLDAGEPDRAIKPLSVAASKLPASQAIATALCTARREWTNVRQEIARLKDLGETLENPAQAADALVQAARTLRMLGTEEREHDACLLAAFHRDPENLSALGMLEARLSHLEHQDAFMKVCERRLAGRTTPETLVDELRRTGLQFYANSTFRSIGVRLLYRSVQTAYKHQLVAIPGHLAMLSVLRQHCQAVGLLPQFLELIDTGLALPLPEIDLLFLALQGLEIAWRLTEDQQSAATYASIAAKIAPKHPLVFEARVLPRVALNQPRGESADSMIFLDQLDLAAPALELGPQVSLRDQLEAAAHIQRSEAVETLDLADEEILEVERSPEPLDLVDEEIREVELSPELLELESEAAESFHDAAEPELELELDLESELYVESEASLELASEEEFFVEVEAEELEMAVELPIAVPLEPTIAPVASPAPAAAPAGSLLSAPSPLAPRPAATRSGTKPPSPATLRPAAPRMSAASTSNAASSLAKAPPSESKAKPKLAAVDMGWNDVPVPVPASEPAPSKPANSALGRISLIPASARAALKTSSAQRNKLPDEAKSRSPRLNMPINVEFEMGETSRHAVTRDVSATGAFFVTTLMIGINQVLDVALLMPLDTNSLRTQSVVLKAMVVRAMPGGYGVVFLEAPSEFHTHLTRLLSQE